MATMLHDLSITADLAGFLTETVNFSGKCATETKEREPMTSQLLDLVQSYNWNI